MAIPHNSKCRYGERGAADAKPKAQIILDAAKESAASGGCSEPKQGQRSQSARGFCPRSTMRVPQPDIIEHFGNADAVPQLPERCLSRKAGIVRCCPKNSRIYCILGSRLIFIVFSRVCFSFLNLSARLAGTRQRRVFVESHRANTDCGNTVEVPARPTPWIRNLYLPPTPILPQPPHKNKTIKPSSQGAAGERAILF